MADILDGKKKFKNFPLQQYQRWHMIQKLSEFNAANTEKRIKRELVRDKSIDGKYQALTARVLQPALHNKRYWLEKLLIPSRDRTVTELYAVSNGLFPISQLQQSRQLAEDIISYIPDVALQPQAIQEQLAGLFANECSGRGIQRLKQAQATFTKAGNVILDGVKSSMQQTEHCMAITSGPGL